MPDERIDALLTELEGLGEDPEELEYWRSILPDMETDQKEELAASLEKELIGLKRATGESVAPSDEERFKAVEGEVRRIKESL